jgi:hypothetical protein
MALGTISIEQSSGSGIAPILTNWQPIIGYTILQNNISGLYYFKLIMEIRIADASGVLLGKIKQKRNGYTSDVANQRARAVFDLKEIINSQLVNTIYDYNDTTDNKPIHTLGKNVPANIFSRNGNVITRQKQVLTIYVKAYQEFSTAQNVSPTENTTTTVNDTKIYMQGFFELEQGETEGTTTIQGNNMSRYAPQTTGARWFITDNYDSYGLYNDNSMVPGQGAVRFYAYESEYRTLAFLNDNTNWGCDLHRIVVRFYDKDGTQLTTGTDYFENTASTGGLEPNSGAILDNTRLLYFGYGPANLENQSIRTNLRPSAYPTWAYYIVSGDNAAGAAVVEGLYCFNLGNTAVRAVAWLNSKGCWDYFSFTSNPSQTVEIKREGYNTLLGDFNSSIYTYNGLDRGRTTLKTTAILKEKLNTGWLPYRSNPTAIMNTPFQVEGQNPLMESLFTSKEVYIVENEDTTYTQAVNITNKTFERKTDANDKMQRRYTIDIEYANPLNTNS